MTDLERQLSLPELLERSGMKLPEDLKVEELGELYWFGSLVIACASSSLKIDPLASEYILQGSEGDQTKRLEFSVGVAEWNVLMAGEMKGIVAPSDQEKENKISKLLSTVSQLTGFPEEDIGKGAIFLRENMRRASTE